MQYECEDIRNLLESDESVSLDSFEKHLAECRRCKKLVQLDPEVEGVLRTNLPGAVPFPVHSNVLNAVKEEGSCISAERRLEKSLPIAEATVLSVIAAIIIFKWNDIKVPFSSIDLISLVKAAGEMISNIKLSALGIERVISFMGNEPLIFAASLGAAALIWGLSFLELERSPR
jgi:hypothetical protein